MRSLAYCLLACLLGAGCAPRTSYNLATEREETTFTSTDKEVDIGRKLAAQVEKELKLVPDQTVQERVRTLGQRLAAVCDRKELLYSFAVIEEPEINAFSLPGGYVFVNEGLIKAMNTDDELAAVLAHEIAHITARHSVKRYESGIGLQLAQLASIAASRAAPGAHNVGIALQSMQLSYARQDELEADTLAVKYMKAAGFDPSAVLVALERIDEAHKDKLRYMPRGVTRPHYAMTHPFVPDRVRAVKEELYGVADYIDYLNSPD